MKKIQMIWAHPRMESLTGRVVASLREEVLKEGGTISELDLYRSNFDPLLQQSDEPDWNNPDKKYSKDVMKLAGELRTQDALIVVFPVWWYSIPAILKGYIERVWNYGIFYGKGRTLPFKTIRWIALTGEPESSFTKRGADKILQSQLNTGISAFCGANDSQVTFLYNTLGEGIDDIPGHHADLTEQARQVVRELVRKSAE